MRLFFWERSKTLSSLAMAQRLFPTPMIGNNTVSWERESCTGSCHPIAKVIKSLVPCLQGPHSSCTVCCSGIYGYFIRFLWQSYISAIILTTIECLNVSYRVYILLHVQPKIFQQYNSQTMSKIQIILTFL